MAVCNLVTVVIYGVLIHLWNTVAKQGFFVSNIQPMLGHPTKLFLTNQYFPAMGQQILCYSGMLWGSSNKFKVFFNMGVLKYSETEHLSHVQA